MIKDKFELFMMKGYRFGVNFEIAHTFDDCILIKTRSSYLLITKFRDVFLKNRISKKEFERFMEAPEKEGTNAT